MLKCEFRIITLLRFYDYYIVNKKMKRYLKKVAKKQTMTFDVD